MNYSNNIYYVFQFWFISNSQNLARNIFEILFIIKGNFSYLLYKLNESGKIHDSQRCWYHIWNISGRSYSILRIYIRHQYISDCYHFFIIEKLFEVLHIASSTTILCFLAIISIILFMLKFPFLFDRYESKNYIFYIFWKKFI